MQTSFLSVEVAMEATNKYIMYSLDSEQDDGFSKIGHQGDLEKEGKERSCKANMITEYIKDFHTSLSNGHPRLSQTSTIGHT